MSDKAASPETSRPPPAPAAAPQSPERPGQGTPERPEQGSPGQRSPGRGSAGQRSSGRGSPVADHSQPSSQVEVDDAWDENDSAFGDSESNYTASLASSVVNYPVEHGRRYHAFRDGRYSRPNDEAEMDRLLLIHEIITLSIGGLYLAPIDPEKTKRILDIGTGNGLWSIMMGDEFPNAAIIGNDLSANMPNFVPANVKFEVDDVESEWLHEEKFSFIFSRYMAASIFEWPKLVKTIHENLEVGGWAEFQDFDLTYYSEDGTLDNTDLHSWITTLTGAADKLGRDSNPGHKLEGWVRGAGFANVVHRKFKVPFGLWPKDPLLKEVGGYNHAQASMGLEGLTMRLYTSVLGWKEEEILALLARVRKDLNNPRIHPIFDLHVVYGQKL